MTNNPLDTSILCDPVIWKHAFNMIQSIISCFYRGWSGGAKVSCIFGHWDVQLILAYSWARPAILVAGKGRGGMFSCPSIGWCRGHIVFWFLVRGYVHTCVWMYVYVYVHVRDPVRLRLRHLYQVEFCSFIVRYPTAGASVYCGHISSYFFCFFTFIPVPLSSLFLSFISSTVSSISFPFFWEMTQNDPQGLTFR